MESRRTVFSALLVLALALGSMLAGCSDGGSPNLAINTAEQDTLQPPPFNLTRFPYPEKADRPPEGYQFIKLATNTPQRGSDFDDWEVDVVWRWWGGDVYLDDVETGISIEPYGIPGWASWIGVTLPDEDEPWVEFMPHGLQFTGPQTARISWAECGLPQGVNPHDLEVWYWHQEINEYEYMGGIVYPQMKYIEFQTDHFSRYIVAAQE